MNAQQRSNLILGLLLLIIGAWFLAARFVPGWDQLFVYNLEWPAIVIAVGLMLIVLAALTRTPGLAVPGSIVSGIGALLYYQNATNNWESWAYAWALIPGFVGVGVLLSSLLEGRVRHGLREGTRLIITSLVMFAIFGAFLGGPPLLRQYWPVLLILAGVSLVLRGLRSEEREREVEAAPSILEHDEGDEAEEPF